MARAYALQLQRFSLPTIDTAIARIVDLGGAFPPSGPQLVAACNDIQDKRSYSERHIAPRRDKVLLPPPVRNSPGGFAHIRDGLRKLLVELRRGR